MTLTLITTDNRRLTLPALLSWRVTWGGSVGCDALEATLAYDTLLYGFTADGYRFEAVWGGVLRLRGVVDEWDVSLTHQGFVATVRGRGLQAMLLDNDALPAFYARAEWADLVSRHAAPYGLTSAVTGLPVQTGFQVSAGEREWDVLTAFAGTNAPLYVSPEGEIRRGVVSGQVSIRIASPGQILQAVWRYDRYHIVSRAVIRNRDRFEQAEETLPEADKWGITRRRVLTGVGAAGMAAMRLKAQHMLADSRQNRLLLRVTLPGAFIAKPYDRVDIALGEPLAGQYEVLESEMVCQAQGLYTELMLRRL